MKRGNYPGLIPLVLGIILLSAGCGDESINSGLPMDIDGNRYDTVMICGQVWLAQNLRVKHYRNGDPIEKIEDKDQWVQSTSGAYCYYENNEKDSAIYGLLYNWYAINDKRNIAPEGWHVPSYDEWHALEVCLGDSIAANKLKEAGNAHWDINFFQSQSTNETGFTAIGSGYRLGGMNPQGAGVFNYRRIESGWWTTTENPELPGSAYHVTMGNNYSILGGCDCPKNGGYSIRLVKD